MIESRNTGAFFTNSYIISNDKNECIIVDPGFSYKDVANYIKKTYIPKAILLTHGHADHIDGIQYFMDLPIYVHRLDEEIMFDSHLSVYDMVGRISPFSSGMLDIRYVNDGDVLKLIGYDIKVLHTPGHTNGSVCYSYEDNVFTGDTLFHMSMGRCDFDTGDLSKMMKSLIKIMKTYPDDYKIYPGHMDISTIGYERKFNPYVTDIVE
ncbi:MAG: MBL fold metallo-hydrolase [Acholeplasmatales bacterium]|nr:MBL fold metallo-hydrolase [Acholeplasmatales bacterium]